MVCRIKNRHTFKSLPILNSAYFTECRFVIRHITQTDTETETEANFTHVRQWSVRLDSRRRCLCCSISLNRTIGGLYHWRYITTELGANVFGSRFHFDLWIRNKKRRVLLLGLNWLYWITLLDLMTLCLLSLLSLMSLLGLLYLLPWWHLMALLQLVYCRKWMWKRRFWRWTIGKVNYVRTAWRWPRMRRQLHCRSVRPASCMRLGLILHRFPLL